jgi:hypothetical protein
MLADNIHDDIERGLQPKRPVVVFGRESTVIEYELDPNQGRAYLYHFGSYVDTFSIEKDPLLAFCEYLERKRIREAELAALIDLVDFLGNVPDEEVFYAMISRYAWVTL